MAYKVSEPPEDVFPSFGYERDKPSDRAPEVTKERDEKEERDEREEKVEVTLPTKPDAPGGQVATIGGEKVYVAGSTMADLGFRTEKEYIASQRTGGFGDGPGFYGPHEGSLVPSDSVLVTYKTGRKERVPADRVPKWAYEKGAYEVELKDAEGKTILVSGKEAQELSGLTGQAQFSKAVELGVVPRGSKYVTGEGDTWSYIPGFEARQKGVVSGFLAAGTARRHQEASTQAALKQVKSKGSDLITPDGTGIYLEMALAAGVLDSTLRELNIPQLEIDKAKAKVVPYPTRGAGGEAVTPGWTVRGAPGARYTIGAYEGKMAPSIIDKAKLLQMRLTPWKEEKGETLRDFAWGVVKPSYAGLTGLGSPGKDKELGFFQRSAEEWSQLSKTRGLPGEEIYRPPIAFVQSPVGAATAFAQWLTQPYKTTKEKWIETGQVSSEVSGVSSLFRGITGRDIYAIKEGTLGLSFQDRAQQIMQGSIQLALVGLAGKSGVSSIKSVVAERGGGGIKVNIPTRLTNRLDNLAKDYVKAETELTKITKGGSTIAFEEGKLAGTPKFYPSMSPRAQALYTKLRSIESRIASTQREIARKTKIKGQPLESGVKYEPYDVYTDRVVSPKEMGKLSRPPSTRSLGKEPTGNLKVFIREQNTLSTLQEQLGRVRGMDPKAIAERRYLTFQIEAAQARLAEIQLGSTKSGLQYAEGIVRGAYYGGKSTFELPKLVLNPYRAPSVGVAPRIYEPLPPGWQPLVSFAKRPTNLFTSLYNSFFGKGTSIFTPKELRGITVDEFLKLPGWQQKVFSDPVKYAEWQRLENRLKAVNKEWEDVIKSKVEKSKPEIDALIEEQSKLKTQVDIARQEAAKSTPSSAVATATPVETLGKGVSYRPTSTSIGTSTGISAFVLPKLLPPISIPGLTPSITPSIFPGTRPSIVEDTPLIVPFKESIPTTVPTSLSYAPFVPFSPYFEAPYVTPIAPPETSSFITPVPVPVTPLEPEEPFQPVFPFLQFSAVKFGPKVPPRVFPPTLKIGGLSRGRRGGRGDLWASSIGMWRVSGYPLAGPSPLTGKVVSSRVGKKDIKYGAVPYEKKKKRGIVGFRSEGSELGQSFRNYKESLAV